MFYSGIDRLMLHSPFPPKHLFDLKYQQSEIKVCIDKNKLMNSVAGGYTFIDIHILAVLSNSELTKLKQAVESDDFSETLNIISNNSNINVILDDSELLVVSINNLEGLSLDKQSKLIKFITDNGIYIQSNVEVSDECKIKLIKNDLIKVNFDEIELFQLRSLFKDFYTIDVNGNVIASDRLKNLNLNDIVHNAINEIKYYLKANSHNVSNANNMTEIKELIHNVKSIDDVRNKAADIFTILSAIKYLIF